MLPTSVFIGIGDLKHWPDDQPAAPSVRGLLGETLAFFVIFGARLWAMVMIITPWSVNGPIPKSAAGTCLRDSRCTFWGLVHDIFNLKITEHKVRTRKLYYQIPPPAAD